MLLREINVGDLANKDLTTLTEEQKKFASRYGYGEFGGESRLAFYNRIKRFIKELEQLDAENIAVFSHAGWMRGMLNLVVKSKLKSSHIVCENCAVAVFEFNKQCWKLHSWINF